MWAPGWPQSALHSCPAGRVAPYRPVRPWSLGTPLPLLGSARLPFGETFSDNGGEDGDENDGEEGDEEDGGDGDGEEDADEENRSDEDNSENDGDEDDGEDSSESEETAVTWSSRGSHGDELISLTTARGCHLQVLQGHMV